jgi:L-amino acid N-acyltransferase YncA
MFSQGWLAWGVLIRDATDNDWPQIFPIFAAVVSEGCSYAYPEDLSTDAARELWMLKPPGRTVVAVEADEIVGTATMGPNRPGRGSHIATASFMVDPRARGRGFGRALGEHTLGWASEQGFRGIQFNAVVETNRAAVRLWQSLGFEIIGTVPGAFRHAEDGYVGLHVMFRSLVPDRPSP